MLESEQEVTIVRSHIIENQAALDKPHYLRTTCDRLLNKQRASRLLALYQQILENGGATATT